jgi:hypothetical protein
LKKPEFICSTIIGTVLIWLVIFGAIDTYSFFQDKETYGRVHQLDMTKAGFDWDYVLGNVFTITIGFIGLAIIISRIVRPKNQIIEKLNLGLIGLALVALVYGLVRLFLDLI